MSERVGRRDFLQRAGALGGGFGIAGMWAPSFAVLQKKSQQKGISKQNKNEEEVSPAEDLMREHGLLNRVLLIYEEVSGRLKRKVDFDPGALAGAARIVQQFIEDYHEKLEEDYLFPRFEKAGRLTPLVRVLREQHQAGRRLTAEIQKRSGSAALKDVTQHPPLEQALDSFVRMYRPHEAREDTVLFPALHDLVSANEYDALGEEFEKKEHQLFGSEGFEGMVVQVADLEKRLGIYELSNFTPR